MIGASACSAGRGAINILIPMNRNFSKKCEKEGESEVKFNFLYIPSYFYVLILFITEKKNKLWSVFFVCLSHTVSFIHASVYFGNNTLIKRNISLCTNS